MVGDVYRLNGNAQSTPEQVTAVIVALVAGKTTSEAAKAAGVLPQNAGMWAIKHRRHVQVLKGLVRPEAVAVYLETFRERVGGGK